MRLFWFLLGLVIGGVGVWIWTQRRCEERITDVRENWERKLRHAEEEVGRADTAHEETKARLRETQEELQRLQQERDSLQSELAQAKRAAEQALEQEKQARAELEQLRAGQKAATAPAPAAAPAQPATTAPRPGEDATGRRLREIDAKLAQLPAGSSARRRLLQERERLAGTPSPGAAGGALPEKRLFEPPAREPDDLTRIRGIGPVIAEKLHALGITTFEQIASLGPDDVARIDEVLAFKGRIERERWIEQAREIVAARGAGS
jgi:predicted flap endonuclease-1-like 5' DNA nuclease